MAIIESNFFSKELFRSVSVDIILPTPESGDFFFDSKTFYPEEGQKYQVLYLLHGFSADHSDWQRFSRIEGYAQKKRLAVVMPGVDNSFYANLPHGGSYYDFYTKELPYVMQKLFPISAKRENNFIAGLSMGGYGAFKAALRNPMQYGAAASLSGGMNIERPQSDGKRPQGQPQIPTAQFLWGAYGFDYEHHKPEEEDLKILLRNAAENKVDLPKLYMCCGTEDFIYKSNVEYRDFAKGLGVDLTYEDGPGIHDWDFWDPYIRRILNWLPLKCGFVD